MPSTSENFTSAALVPASTNSTAASSTAPADSAEIGSPEYQGDERPPLDTEKLAETATKAEGRHFEIAKPIRMRYIEHVTQTENGLVVEEETTRDASSAATAQPGPESNCNGLVPGVRRDDWQLDITRAEEISAGDSTVAAQKGMIQDAMTLAKDANFVGWSFLKPGLWHVSHHREPVIEISIITDDARGEPISKATQVAAKLVAVKPPVAVSNLVVKEEGLVGKPEKCTDSHMPAPDPASTSSPKQPTPTLEHETTMFDDDRAVQELERQAAEAERIADELEAEEMEKEKARLAAEEEVKARLAPEKKKQMRAERKLHFEAAEKRLIEARERLSALRSKSAVEEQ